MEMLFVQWRWWPRGGFVHLPLVQAVSIPRGIPQVRDGVAAASTCLSPAPLVFPPPPRVCTV